MKRLMLAVGVFIFALSGPVWAKVKGGYGPKALIPQWINPQRSPAAPIFDHLFGEGSLASLAAHLDGYKSRGSKVVRVQVLETSQGTVVQALKPGEARYLPPGRSVTVWGYYGRGKNTSKSLTRLQIRQATVEDHRPAAPAVMVRRYDGVVTAKGWVRSFRGKSTLRFFGAKPRVSYSTLSSNPWNAQVTAGVNLREPLARVWWALANRGLRAVVR